MNIRDRVLAASGGVRPRPQRNWVRRTFKLVVLFAALICCSGLEVHHQTQADPQLVTVPRGVEVTLTCFTVLWACSLPLLICFVRTRRSSLLLVTGCLCCIVVTLDLVASGYHLAATLAGLHFIVVLVVVSVGGTYILFLITLYKESRMDAQEVEDAVELGEVGDGNVTPDNTIRRLHFETTIDSTITVSSVHSFTPAFASTPLGSPAGAVAPPAGANAPPAYSLLYPAAENLEEWAANHGFVVLDMSTSL